VVSSRVDKYDAPVAYFHFCTLYGQILDSTLFVLAVDNYLSGLNKVMLNRRKFCSKLHGYITVLVHIFLIRG